MFAALPDSGVSALQNSLFKNGVTFKADPTGTDIYGIAGFASLHVSVVVTACLFFERTGQRAAIRIAGWAFLAMTLLATVYFGWHYIADDVAGAIIGWAAVSIGAWATGNRGRRKRRLAEDDETAGRHVDAEPSDDSGDAVPSVTPVDSSGASRPTTSAMSWPTSSSSSSAAPRRTSSTAPSSSSSASTPSAIVEMADELGRRFDIYISDDAVNAMRTVARRRDRRRAARRRPAAAQHHV